MESCRPGALFTTGLLVTLLLLSPSASGETGASSDPVVRAAAGDWGMFFRAGGLANLTLEQDAMNVSGGSDGLLVTQVGLRPVITEHWIIPFHVGMGVRFLSPDVGDTRTDFGLLAGVGVEYHFRIWRRISPFVGGGFNIGMDDPSGGGNWAFMIGLAPTLGIEYYIGDRVSLLLQYLMSFDFTFQDGGTSMRVFNTRAGGALSIAFYF